MKNHALADLCMEAGTRTGIGTVPRTGGKCSSLTHFLGRKNGSFVSAVQIHICYRYVCVSNALESEAFCQ